MNVLDLCIRHEIHKPKEPNVNYLLGVIEALRKGKPEPEKPKPLLRLYVEVDPAVMYPAIITRIRDVIAGKEEMPSEILHSPGVLKGNRYNHVGDWEKRVAQVPDAVWQDALAARSTFPALPSSIGLDWIIKVGARSIIADAADLAADKLAEESPDTERPEFTPERIEVNTLLAQAGIVDGVETVLTVARRAYALELALGWFQTAVRVEAYKQCGRARAEIIIQPATTVEMVGDEEVTIKNLDYKLL